MVLASATWCFQNPPFALLVFFSFCCAGVFVPQGFDCVFRDFIFFCLVFCLSPKGLIDLFFSSWGRGQNAKFCFF